MREMNDIDMIVGQPLLFNYYSIFSVQDGKLGLYSTTYTKTSRELTLGAISCLGLFVIILILGVLGCIYKYNQNDPDTKVRVLRNKSEKN